MTLKLRLLLSLGVVFFVGFVGTGATTYILLQSFLVNKVDQQLYASHSALEQQLMISSHLYPPPTQPSSSPQGKEAPDGNVPPGGRGQAPPQVPSDTYCAILNTKGKTVAYFSYAYGSTRSTTIPMLPSTSSGSMQPGTYLTVPGTHGVSPYRVYIDTSLYKAGDLLVVGIPLDDVNTTLGDLLEVESILAGIVTCIVIFASWWIVSRGLRPLEVMGTTARDIVSSNDFTLRVTPDSSNTEVGRMGQGLNAMFAELHAVSLIRDSQEAKLRHFLSDASHELRTPLTSMRGYAELIRRNPDMDKKDLLVALKRIESETSRMTVLVEDLLLLARLDQGRPLEHDEFDLVPLIHDISIDARVADSEHEIVETTPPAFLWVGDALKLRQAISNLVRNAQVHTPNGTSIEILLEQPQDVLHIQVVDHGPGIPDAAQDHIFERFSRADPQKSRDQGGSGLGLSITHAIVQSLGGAIYVNTTPGGGATFTITFPASLHAD